MSVSNVHHFLPKLTMNSQFVHEFMAADTPCFALGLAKERKQQCAFLAMRPSETIPREIADKGFNFGHALLGVVCSLSCFGEFEVIL